MGNKPKTKKSNTIPRVLLFLTVASILTAIFYRLGLHMDNKWDGKFLITFLPLLGITIISALLGYFLKNIKMLLISFLLGCALFTEAINNGTLPDGGVAANTVLDGIIILILFMTFYVLSSKWMKFLDGIIIMVLIFVVVYDLAWGNKKR